MMRDPLRQFSLPPWITSKAGQSLEDMSFSSGAAVHHLHLLLARNDVPTALLRDRLCFLAAANVMQIIGRRERIGDLRDVVHLSLPGDALGPAGEICERLRRASARPVSASRLAEALHNADPTRAAHILKAGQGAPVARAAAVLEAALTDDPKDESGALTLADAALAQAMGGRYLVPLLGVRLRRRDLALNGEALRQACHRAVIMAAKDVADVAVRLVRQGARLHAIRPKLRARQAQDAVAMFLAVDGITAPRLADPALGAGMTDRAARRLCDRLMDLGAIQELTGRDTYRIYGL